MKKKKLIKAAKTINKYCKRQAECRKCPFIRDDIFCKIGDYTPDKWDTPKK